MRRERFIAKPIDRTELRARTLTMLKMKAAQDAVKQHQANLEAMIEERTAQLRSAPTHVEAPNTIFRRHLDTVRRLAIAAEHRDEDTATHIYRVGAYCQVLGAGLGLSAKDVEILHHASFLHDVGKIAIPDAILLKRGPLTTEEYTIVKQHTVIGAEVLKGSTSDLLRAGYEIALTHHERWDGSGYPNGIAGENIPPFGRIEAVADVFDALMTERFYKPAFSLEKTLEIMRDGRGAHFDPLIVDTFIANLDDLMDVRACYVDDKENAKPKLELWTMVFAA